MTRVNQRKASLPERIKQAFGKCQNCGKWERSMFGHWCMNEDCDENPGKLYCQTREDRTRRIKDGIMIALICTSVDRRSRKKMSEAAAQIARFVERELDR